MFSSCNDTRILPFVLSTAVCAGVCCSASAQPQWTITNAGIFLEANAFANEFSNDFGPQDPLGDGVTQTAGAMALIGGFDGRSFGNRVIASVTDRNSFITPRAFAISCSAGQVLIDGDGTMEVEISWDILTTIQVLAPEDFDTTGDSTLNQVPGAVSFFVELDTTGVPPATPLIIFYNWDVMSSGFSDFEPPADRFPNPDPPPDFAIVSDTTLAIDGVDQLLGRFDFNITPPFTSINFTLNDQPGQLNINAGQKILIEVTGFVEAGCFGEGKGLKMADDGGFARFKGRIRLSTGTPPIPGPPGGLANIGIGSPLPNSFLDFSVDIGSDAELSEFVGPLPEAIEVFDPGDVYAWKGPSLPPGGADGYRNDADAFGGLDPNPVPQTLGTEAPLCFGALPPDFQASFFDLDGHDAVDFDIDLLIDAASPMPSPIGRFGSQCTYDARFLYLSYEDDDSLPYNDFLCDYPANTLSPSGLIHGDGLTQDEVIGIEIFPFAPAPIINQYSLASENFIHISMDPNPNGGMNEWDDDVDSIDIPADPLLCDRFLFGADHEAPGTDPLNFAPLDPGAIYLSVAGAAPQLVIHPQTHLGLNVGIDIADFELVWLRDTITGTNTDGLALVFAVHPDDPTTAVDESGGLDPKMLYASFMTGSSFPLLLWPIIDVIDGVTAYKFDLSTQTPPPCCLGDANLNKVVNFGDITEVLGNWLGGGPLGDANCDGVVNFADITEVLGNWLSVCP